MNELQGKVALITGGTDGIGKEMARGLIRRGAEVVIVGRNSRKGHAAAEELGGRDTAVTFIQADLSLMSAVRELAEAFQLRHNRLDILVHSAGVIHMGLKLTTEGLETNFAVDYLSRFLLSHLLLDVMRASAPARIINIAAARGKGTLNFEQIRRPKYGGMRALGQAQLANELFTLTLAERLEGSGVETAVIHPGAVDTNIRRQFPRLVNAVMGFIFSRMVMSPAEGAELPLWLATKADDINGKLYKPPRQEISPAAGLRDPEQRRRLWQLSAELVGLGEQEPTLASAYK